MNLVERELEMRRLPQLMLFQDGGPVKTAEDWKHRREEIRELLCRECFGFPPRLSYEVSGQVVNTQEDAYGGKADSGAGNTLTLFPRVVSVYRDAAERRGAAAAVPLPGVYPV